MERKLYSDKVLDKVKEKIRGRLLIQSQCCIGSSLSRLTRVSSFLDIIIFPCPGSFIKGLL